MSSMLPPRWPCLLLWLTPLLATGCSSLFTEGASDAAGIAGAGVASAVTKNATLGAGIGIGVKSLADVGVSYARRRVHGHEQDNIASVAGPLPIGAVGSWQVSHDIPIENDEHGEVTVARDLGGGDFACREIVFSVVSGATGAEQRSFFTATICKDGTIWKWATAEPSTARWDGLQ
jgi:hypothetical protein